MSKQELYEILSFVTEYEGELKDELLLERDLCMESLMFIDLVAIIEKKENKKYPMHKLLSAASVGDLYSIVG